MVKLIVADDQQVLKRMVPLTTPAPTAPSAQLPAAW
jgi:hypothetical protein